MKQVATKKDEINVSLVCYFEAFFKCIKRVRAYDWIFFLVAHVVVGRYQDFKNILFRLFFD